MTTDTTQTKEVLRDLVASFTNHPEAIEIDAQIATGSAYWMLRGHPEDEPVLIGKQGSHVRALEFLVRCFGTARNEVHTFRLLTEQAPRVRPPMEPRAVMRFDPKPARELLIRILEELAIGDFFVDVGPGNGERRSLTFVFTIKVRDARDYDALLVPQHPGPGREESIVEALGTLFRAIAKKNGVRFEITIAKS